MIESIFHVNDEESREPTAILNPDMDLGTFLEDDYLKSEGYDEIASNPKGCTDRRGSAGSAWRK